MKIHLKESESLKKQRMNAGELQVWDLSGLQSEFKANVGELWDIEHRPNLQYHDGEKRRGMPEGGFWEPMSRTDLPSSGFKAAPVLGFCPLSSPQQRSQAPCEDGS